MSYLLLIMEDREARRNRSAEDGHLRYERMNRFVEDLKGRGVFKASESLRSLSDGVRISARGGKRTVVDGPFAEAKEVVGGFFLLECRNREQAITIAGECPATEWATVEVREVGPCYAD